MEDIPRRNLLVREGRRLASEGLSQGDPSELTAAQWLSLYEELKDYLVGAQADHCAYYAERIRKLYPELEKDTKP